MLLLVVLKQMCVSLQSIQAKKQHSSCCAVLNQGARLLTQGRGILYGADGSRFSGTFERGQLHGHGQQTERDGSSFAGMFKAGSRSGAGVQTTARGDVFCGTYVCGARQGQGSYVFSTNNARLDAFYEADIPRRAAANSQPRIEASRAVVPQDTAIVAQSEQLFLDCVVRTKTH